MTFDDVIITSDDLVEVPSKNLHLGFRTWPKIQFTSKNWVISFKSDEFENFPIDLAWSGPKNWPDLRSQISKIRDIRIVPNLTLINSCEFENNRIKTVVMAWHRKFSEVRSLIVTWWPDLRWPGVKNCTQCVKLITWGVLKIWWRCSQIWVIHKKPQGGPLSPPPSGARVKTRGGGQR